VPRCQPGLEECTADAGIHEGTILARELPHAPLVYVPVIGDPNGFTSTTLVVTFKDSAEWNGSRAFDKFKIEWDLLPSFTSNKNLGKPESFDIGAGTSPEVIASNTVDGNILYTYTIEDVTPGFQYFIRVSGHNSLGYGEPSSGLISIPRRPSDPVEESISLNRLVNAVPEDRTSSLQLDWSRPPDEGGSPVTSYLIEWSRAPWCVTVSGFQDDQGECLTDRNMDRASYEVSTACDAPCEVDGSFRLSLDTESCDFCAVKTTEMSQNLRYDMSAAEMKVALENMPNIGVVSVIRTDIDIDRRTAKWEIEFASEIGDVPIFELPAEGDALLVDSSGNDVVPSVLISPVTTGTNPPENDYCGGEDCVIVAVEDTSDTTFSYILTGSASSPLLAGQQYYARVSAGNAIGYGPRRNAPPMTVPMDVPSSPTSYFHAEGAPSLSVAGPQSLLVSFGPPTYDGGDSLSGYRIEWDVENTFTGSDDGTPLGFHTIDLADLQICSWCATSLENDILAVDLEESELNPSFTMLQPFPHFPLTTSLPSDSSNSYSDFNWPFTCHNKRRCINTPIQIIACSVACCLALHG